MPALAAPWWRRLATAGGYGAGSTYGTGRAALAGGRRADMLGSRRVRAHWGARISLVIAVAATALGAVGSVVGLVSGYTGAARRGDQAIDCPPPFPVPPEAIAVIAVAGPSVRVLVVCRIGDWVAQREDRGGIVSLRERD